MKNTPIKHPSRKALLLGLFLTLIATWSAAQFPSVITPDGFADVYEYGCQKSHYTIVSTPEEFKEAANNYSSNIIYVDGMLDVGDVLVGSNTAIVGLDAHSGLKGNLRLHFNTYILQNLILGPNPNGSVLSLTGAKNVFIHKCDLYDGADGNLNIIKGADNVTVSWCKFYFTDTALSGNAMLIGNSDNATNDEGKLHVTIHHCWFAEGCVSRMPRVRYGNVHLYNNYYSSEGSRDCIGTGYKCNIRCENSYFDNVGTPWRDYRATSSGGEMGWKNLKFVNCQQPTYLDNNYPVSEVSYGYHIYNVEYLKDIVTRGAGNNSTNPMYFPPTLNIAPPSGLYPMYEEADTVTIAATASDIDGEIAKVEFFLDTVSLGVFNTAPYSLDWNAKNNGVYKLTAKATDNHGNITVSPQTTFTVGLIPCGTTTYIAPPFAQDGPGEFCWRSYGIGNNVIVNSWGLETLEINGVDMTNTSSTTIPDNVFGFHFIHYVSNNDSSHFEIMPNTSDRALTKNVINTNITADEAPLIDFNCYPNPVHDVLNIKLNNENNEAIHIYLLDATGRLMKSSKSNSATHRIDLTAMPSGLYLLKVLGSGYNLNKRIIKQ